MLLSDGFSIASLLQNRRKAWRYASEQKSGLQKKSPPE
jgi:hypothetical protein